jgi:hypothetical protein
MIDRNHSDWKYVEIFTHRFCTIGAPSRMTVFIRGTNTKFWEVPNIASRNTQTNIFQVGSAGFKAAIDWSRKKVHQGDVSFYVRNVDLIPLMQKYKYKEHEGNNDRNKRTQISSGCAQACWPR